MICVRSTEAGPIALPGDFFRPRFLQPSNAGYWRIDGLGRLAAVDREQVRPNSAARVMPALSETEPGLPHRDFTESLGLAMQSGRCLPRWISPTHAALMGHGVGCRFRRGMRGRTVHEGLSPMSYILIVILALLAAIAAPRFMSGSLRGWGRACDHCRAYAVGALGDHRDSRDQHHQDARERSRGRP